MPCVSRRLLFTMFMQRLYLHGWLIRADPVSCPDIQCLRVLVDKCHWSKLWPRDVITYAVCGALLHSLMRMAAMADATCPACVHCTKEHSSKLCGTNPCHCVCCRHHVSGCGAVWVHVFTCVH